jgi:hypothetical protein
MVDFCRIHDAINSMSPVATKYLQKTKKRLRKASHFLWAAFALT